MLLYLAGLKSVDSTLREAASIDGASEWQTFLRVVFPVMRPINVVILVITIIESLRAFDLAFIINKGLNGLELLSTLITNNIVGETSRIGFGSAIAVVLLWLFPLGWAVFASFRSYADTTVHGFLSWPQSLSLDNYVNAWDRVNLPNYFLNTALIVVPATILVLLLASMMAFAVSRFSWRFNLALLLLFTAANLLPPQVIITPLFRLYLVLPLPAFFNDRGLFYDSYIGIIVIHIAFQLGFCTFVLSNYMRTLPREL